MGGMDIIRGQWTSIIYVTYPPFISALTYLCLCIARFIIRCNDIWKFWWDIYVLVLAIAICFLLPAELAYTPPWGHQTPWKAFEYTVEAFFCLDVLIHFNTTVYDSDGNEIFDRWHIAHHYVTELHFWIDMAATIPLGVSFNS